MSPMELSGSGFVLGTAMGLLVALAILRSARP